MSNKKKKKSEHNINSGKVVFKGITYGLVLGSTIGFILCLFLDNIVWFIGAPLIGLCIGLFIGSVLQSKYDNKHKYTNKNNHSINKKVKKAH